MERAKLEGQNQLMILQEELSSSKGRSLELERRVVETEEQMGLLRGVEDATYAEAFQLGAEEIRTKISRERPEWDLSFLDVEAYEACTPGAEEDEYDDVSDVDLGAILGSSEAAAPGGHSRHAIGETTTLEVGEASRSFPDVVEEAVGTTPTPDS